jgi:3-oxoacyl-[acyl-carrier protein] reductase
MTDERREELRNEVLLKRWGTAQDVANALLFLSSDEASYITGEAMDVNGGHYVD